MPTPPSAAQRRSARSGSPYEDVFGFSRGVRVGGVVHIAGTGPVWPDGACDPDPAVQARRCWEIAATALRDLGADLGHVVRTRMYVTDPAVADEVGRVHGEVFGAVRPAATMVVVAGLVDPRWHVEVAAEALVSEEGSDPSTTERVAAATQDQHHDGHRDECEALQQLVRTEARRTEVRPFGLTSATPGR